MYFLAPFVASLIVVLIPLLFLFWRAESKLLLVGAAGALVVVYTIIGWWPLGWFFRPITGFNWETFYHSWWLWFIGLVIASVALGAVSVHDNEDAGVDVIALGVVLVLLLIHGLWNMLFSSVLTTPDGKALASLINVVKEEPGSYPDTDSNHVSYVPWQTAALDAGQAMNSSSIGNLSSAFSAMSPVRQSVQHHVYWISPLQVASWNAYTWNGIKTVPAFVAVDAENPAASAKVHDKNADGSPIAIKYVVDGPWESNLQRYVWSNGYADVPIEDWTLEVDDNWRPFWTATINQNSIGFSRTVPSRLMTVDAQTGEIKTYALNEVPQWVDRIYSEEDAKELMNWWGDFHSNDMGIFGWGRGSQDRLHVNGSVTLVYTKEDYPVWQMQLSSLNNDGSVAYLALFDGRVGSVRLYQISDMQTEERVSEAIAQTLQKPDRIAAEAAVHKIHGKLTWVIPLIPAGSGDKAATQGVALVPVNSTASASTISSGTTMNDALAAYDSKSSGGVSTKPSEDTNLAKATGIVTDLTPWDEGGTTVRYFRLKDDKGVLDKTHVYKLPFMPSQADSNAEAAIIHDGARVMVSYAEANGVRTVQGYDDLDIG